MAQSMYSAGMTPNQIATDAQQTGKESDKGPQNDDYWLMIARDAFTEAESYYDANIRKNHERNMAHFQNRHAPGSKYSTDAYKYRKKGFRPKTRSFVRRNESALVKAMFSTSDFVTVKAARSNHPSHRVSAEINQELLQYRLTNTIPWFQTVIGAYQETLNLGLCVSYQFWDYEEQGPMPDYLNRDVDSEVSDIGVSPGEGLTPPEDSQEESVAGLGQDGTELNEDVMPDNVIELDVQFDEPGEIVKDTPSIDLRPAENVFFSQAADWRDPINTSPYVIDMVPMYVDEVKAMADPKRNAGQTPWFSLTEGQILTGVTTDYNSVRRQREENREDSKDQRYLHRGFDTVWVHRNIVKKDGIDWIYYTLGVHFRLSDPVPLRKEYPWLKPGERPYVVGFSNLEAHKNYPESLTGISAGTQQKANELDNLRGDNVELSLNRRYIVKRGAMIDYRGLQRNVPGGVTETDDPTNDIRMEQPPDVTASSYREQDLINGDFDELVGMFSGSSVGSNRSMNETVGGMKLLAGDADSLTEYPLMVFVITWVLPVLKQLVRLEQAHESDAALLNLIGEKIKFWQRYKPEGDDNQRLTDKWIQGSMNVDVSVGFGATNPEQRLQRIQAGMMTIAQIAPAMMQKADGQEVAKEVMGAIGFKGTERFFPDGGPKVPVMPQNQEGQLTEKDQAELDQGAKKDEAKQQLDEARLKFEIERHYNELEERSAERLHKKEISQLQHDEKMARIKTDRQSAVDEMKIKLREGSGI